MATGRGKDFHRCPILLPNHHSQTLEPSYFRDRNNLGKQTTNEFQQFVSPVSGQVTEE